MKLQEAIEKIIDGNAVLFLGSGFSYGGKNKNGDILKTGKDLSHVICDECGITHTDDLTISSDRYVNDPTCKKSLKEFIAFLEKEVYCTETTHSQDVVASLPWKRIYTTNYDNAFELASRKNGNTRKSITITNKRYFSGQNLAEAILHINGSVLKLNENTFYDEFKITDESYTKSGLVESKWCQLFDADMESSEVVVFIGYSLNYDQELVRHISNLRIKDKCIFIDISDISSDSEYKIKKYGELYKIGIDGFASKAEYIKSTYHRKIYNKQIKGFSERKRESYYSEKKYTITDLWDFYIKGNINIKFLNQENYCLCRKEKINSIKNYLVDNKVIVIESKLGNGKSVLLECLANDLVDEYHVYFVENLDTMIDDLNLIFKISDDKNIIFMIDDYGSYIKLIKEIGHDFPENLRLIMTCRSSINVNLYYDLYNKYGIEQNQIKLVNIDKIDEIHDLILLLNKNRFWGEYDTLSYYKKKKIILNKYNASISCVFYILVNSVNIKNEIEKIINELKNKEKLFDFVLAQSINNICNLKFSYNDILKYVDINDTLLRSYSLSSPMVNDVINNQGSKFVLSSSIYSQYMVKEASMSEFVLGMLADLFEKSSVYDRDRNKYMQQRRNMVSRSNILLLLSSESGGYDSVLEMKILNYFDKIKNYPTATDNPFFWFQYGITALNLKMFDLASLNFENAYANADEIDGFDTFQLDTHKARLLLNKEMNSNNSNKEDAMSVFFQAHELLINCKDKGERLKFVLRQVECYKDYFDFYKSIFDEGDKRKFWDKSIEMLKKYDLYFSYIDEERMSKEMMKSYRSFHNLFRNTPYILQFKKTDALYNSKVPDKRMRVV